MISVCICIGLVIHIAKGLKFSDILFTMLPHPERVLEAAADAVGPEVERDVGVELGCNSIDFFGKPLTLP